MLSIRTFLLVAFVMALVAFALGQLREGAGVMFVAAATPLWTIYAAQLARRARDAAIPKQ